MKALLRLLSLIVPLSVVHVATARASPWEKEVFYQIFPRSFYDSNGDRIGDLKGIEQKLGYIQGLGATSILINPVFSSRVYHNYFADDFMKIDPEFGTNDDFFHLVREAHRRHMKVILDMEVQYVADRHPWLASLLTNERSPYKDYLWTKGSWLYDMDIHWYDGAKVKVAAVNPDNQEVRRTMRKVFRYWTAPDGRRNDGVDGFRIDHMMDDLDSKHLHTGMLKSFWTPIIQDVRKIKPNAFFVGEQADWGLGTDLFKGANVDAAFAFPLKAAIVTWNRAKIETELHRLQEATPPGKTELVFVENHDMTRFATQVGSDPALLKLGAVLNLTLKGTPIIYYGQELGMKGKQGNWNSDGNDIPIRLAFRWSETRAAVGTPTWYKDTGPWSSDAYSADHDKVSLEEEQGKPDSLYEFYRGLIAFRKKSPALSEGSETMIDTGNPNILAYLRKAKGDSVLVAVNLSAEPQTWKSETMPIRYLWRGKNASLAPHGFAILGKR